MNAISNALEEHASVLESIRGMSTDIETIAKQLNRALLNGGTLFLCGNGGSASDSQHIAAELVGRFQRERRALPAIALTTDTSILTSVGNDYDFDAIFSRQVEALVKPGDVLIGLSTSGNSRNVLRAIDSAKQQQALTIGLSGNQGGQLLEHCDHCLVIPSTSTARIQEMHILIGHILCDSIDANPDFSAEARQ